MVLKLGLLCSHSVPAARPSMRQVMEFLDGNANLPELPDGSTLFGTFKGNEEHDFLLSLPSSFGKGSAVSLSSTNSILINGH